MQAIGRQPPGEEACEFGLPLSLAGRIRRRDAKAEKPARTEGARRTLRPKQGGDDRLQGSLEIKSESRSFETPKTKTSSGAGRAAFTDGYTRGRSLRPRPQRGFGVGGSKARKQQEGGIELPALGPGSGTLRGNSPKTARRRDSREKARPTAGRPGAQSAERRRGVGTWEGAERSGVGAQGPVAHSRDKLQAEDLLQEPGGPPAAAAPLVLHPAAIHRTERGESARSVAVARSHIPPGSLYLGRLSVTFGPGPSSSYPNGAVK